MEPIAAGILCLILFVSVWRLEAVAAGLFRKIYDGFQRCWGKVCLIAALKTVLMTAAFVLRLPLPVLYLCMFLFSCADFYEIRKVMNSGYLFWANLIFCLYAVFHMSVLSLISVIAGQPLHQVYLSGGIGPAASVTAVIASALTVRSLCNIQISRFYTLLKEEVHLRRMISFEWFMVGYIFFDSILCIFNLPYLLVSWFLLGSCAVIMIQFCIYVRNIYQIIAISHYEKEYYNLQTEQMEHEKKERELKRLAYHDSLTGVHARRYALEFLQGCLRDGRHISLAYVDINGLKGVNDTFGHLEGDRYLINVVKALNEILKEDEVLARIGGDEFLVISLLSAPDNMDARLKAANERLGEAKGYEYRLSFSYGIVEVNEGEKISAEELIRSADRLMYQYKQSFYAADEEDGG